MRRESQPMNPNGYDTVIIGAGPGGASAAAALAQRRHQVLILEPSHFPRYAIGESIIPYT